MNFGRRSLLGRLFAAAASPVFAGVGSGDAASANEALVAAYGGMRDAQGRFRVTGIGTDLGERAGLVTGLRLHAVVPAPGGGAVAVARRPGHLAFVLDAALETPLVIHAASGRCFAGHGVFIDGGTTLAIAEIDEASGDGFIALHDVAAGYQRTGEYRTGGIGPHEIVHLPGGILAIANGAREPNTDPSLDALLTTEADSTIAFTDSASGAIQNLVGAGSDFAGVSLRHMAADRQGGLVVAAQESEPGIADRPLLFSAGRDGVTPFGGNESLWLSLKGYVGSIAVDRSARYALISSPRGGVVWAFDILGRRPVGSLRITDVCGITADGSAGGFIATSGLGMVARLRATAEGLAMLAQHASAASFDNHLFAHPG